MKVLLVNGSPHKDGATNLALEEVSKTLNKNGIETEIFWIGNKPISGCIGCGACFKTKRCFINDKVNEFVEKAIKADGFVFGSPVYYAHPSGRLLSFMDRVFYAGNSNFAFKPAAAVVSARRAGTTASLDVITKHFTICNMPVVSSCYWPMVHGAQNSAEQAKQDLEGMQIMRTLGNNMAWILKCIEAGKNAGINRPTLEDRIYTNFIR